MKKTVKTLKRKPIADKFPAVVISYGDDHEIVKLTGSGRKTKLKISEINTRNQSEESK